MSDTAVTTPTTAQRFVTVQINQYRGLVTWCRRTRERMDAIENLHTTRPAPNGVEYCISCHCPGPCATLRALGRVAGVRARYRSRAL